MEQYADKFERECCALRARLSTEENKSRILEAELKALRAQQSPRPLWPDDDPMIVAMADERDTLRARVEKLERVKKYAAHSPGCSHGTIEDVNSKGPVFCKICTCGLNAALAECKEV
jgi:hypothetical protein